MDELTYVKNLENKIAGEIENAKKNAEEKFNKTKSMREQRIREMIEKANMEINTDIENAKKRAKEEVEEIIGNMNPELDEIEKKGNKNLDNAVKIVIDEFLNIK